MSRYFIAILPPERISNDLRLKARNLSHKLPGHALVKDTPAHVTLISPFLLRGETITEEDILVAFKRRGFPFSVAYPFLLEKVSIWHDVSKRMAEDSLIVLEPVHEVSRAKAEKLRTTYLKRLGKLIEEIDEPSEYSQYCPHITLMEQLRDSDAEIARAKFTKSLLPIGFSLTKVALFKKEANRWIILATQELTPG